VLFHAADLQISEELIRTPAGRLRIADVRRVWVTRRAGRGSRTMTAALGVAAVLVVIGGVGLSGWLADNWPWLLTAPVIFVVVVHFGLLDPIAIYLEKRHHELWVATDHEALCIFRANSVEARKAQRAIERAAERRAERR
jgi:hypothetical protein